MSLFLSPKLPVHPLEVLLLVVVVGVVVAAAAAGGGGGGGAVAAVAGSSTGSEVQGREEEGVSGADGDGVEARALQLLGADPSRDQHIPRLLIRHRVPQVHVPRTP